VLDVTFREDDSRVRDRTAARNLALLRKIALNLVAEIAAAKPAYAVGARRPPGTTTTCSRSSPAKLMREPLAVAGATGFAGLGAAGLYGGRKSVAAEPPPEVTTIRFEKDPVTCIAPQAAEELLRAEGFTDIRYVDVTEAHVRRAELPGRGPWAI
jgi:hypothetical protein